MFKLNYPILSLGRPRIMSNYIAKFGAIRMKLRIKVIQQIYFRRMYDDRIRDVAEITLCFNIELSLSFAFADS